jgi:type IV secretion system protein VirB10
MRASGTFHRFLAFLTVLLLAAALAGAQEPAEAETPGTPAGPGESETSAARSSDKVIVPVGTHLPLVLQNTISTKTAAAGDPVYFETIYPVVVKGRILIPVGSYVRGTVTHAKRPGRIKGRGELHVRFDELTLPNGYTVNLSASLANAGANQGEEVDREEGRIKGDSSKGRDVGTVATATATGAGIGAIAGEGKGLAIGAGAGAAAGLAAVLLTRGRELELPRGTTFDIVFDRSLELDGALVQFEWTGQSTSLPGPAPRGRDNRSIIPRFPY